MMHIELLGYHCQAIFMVFQDSRDIWIWHCIFWRICCILSDMFLIHRGFFYMQ